MVVKKIEKIIKMPVLHINTILAGMDKLPNLLSVDTEGMDFRILSALDCLCRNRWGRRRNYFFDG